MQPDAALRNQLARYIADRDICMDLDTFAEWVRHFFDESQQHHDRLAYRDAIAECLGLDMTKSGDRDKLWRRIATERGCDRKTRIRWLSEEADPPLDHISIYFRSLGAQPRLPFLDDVIAPVRTGIARTLTYIRVFPPTNPGGDITDAKPETLKQCRERLRRHAHYRKHRNLNQHAIDWVRDEYRNAFWIDASAIGELKCQVETNYSNALIAAWIMFKFATMTPVYSSNKPKANPHKWIWDDAHPRHADVWSLQNGRA